MKGRKWMMVLVPILGISVALPSCMPLVQTAASNFFAVSQPAAYTDLIAEYQLYLKNGPESARLNVVTQGAAICSTALQNEDDIRPCLGIVAAMGLEFPQGLRVQLTEKIDATVVPSDTAAADGVDPADVLQTAAALNALHASPDIAGKFAVRWVNASNQCTSATPEVLSSMACLSDRAPITEGRPALNKVLDRVEHEFLLDAEHVRSVDPVSWSRLVRPLSKIVSEELRVTWRTDLFNAYTTDTAVLSGMTLQDCIALKKAIGELGAAETPLVFTNWVDRTEVWKSLDLEQLAIVGRELAWSMNQGSLDRLIAYIEGKYFVDPGTVQEVAPQLRKLMDELNLSPEKRALWLTYLES